MSLHGIQGVSEKVRAFYRRQPRFDTGELDRPRLGELLAPKPSGVHISKRPLTKGASAAATASRTIRTSGDSNGRTV